MIKTGIPANYATANLNFNQSSSQAEGNFSANFAEVEIKQGRASILYWLLSGSTGIKQNWAIALQSPPSVEATIQYTTKIIEGQGINANFRPSGGSAIPTEQITEGQALIKRMQANGLLANAEIVEADESELEALLPPYGSEEEANLFQELANELSKVFQATGTTIADEIAAERDE